MMRLLVSISLILLTACHLPATPEVVEETPSPYTSCPLGENDALIACPMNWEPVCGQLADLRWESYANDCDACANGVSRYVSDSCDFVDLELISND